MTTTTFDDDPTPGGPTPDEGPEHDNVIRFRLPTPPAGPRPADNHAESLRLVVDGQVLHDGQGDEAGTGQALDRVGAGDRLPVLRRAGRTAARGTIQVITTARVVATHPHTRTAGKALGRNLWYSIAGAGVAAARWRDAHGANRYERMMRAAEIAGDRDALLEWEARDAAEKARRHTRVMDWITSPLVLVKAFAIAVVSFTVLLLGLGVILAVADSDISQVLAPIVGVIDLVRWVAWFLTAYGAFLLLTATAGALVWLWALGRKHTEPPAWIAPTVAEDGPARDLVPDEGAIMAALRNLNLPPLARKLKEGWTPRWVLGTGRDGRGWRTQLELPPGVTVEMINDRKTVLAHNLVRLPVEVWPTEPKNLPGVLDLWVADQGLLTGPVDPYPLLGEGTTDYFRGVPVGIDQRGDTVTGKLMAANYAAAGIMGSGKTSLVINLLSGAILDPLVEVDVYCMAFNVDYDPFRPRLRTLVKGDEDEHITTAIDALRELRSEVTARGKILAELGGDETKLTREIAERDTRMRPRVVVFDECQELFRHETFGEEAKQLAIKVMMKARKCGITLLFVTPAPSADSLPRDLAKTVSHRVCFAIGDHQGNDAILGTGAHRQGITATHLVPGEDVGTAMASGFGPRPGLLRTFYIRRDKTVDQLSPIVARALALREAAGITDTPTAPAPPVEVLDPLADIADVLAGHKRLRTQEVLSLLAARNRPAYGAWTFERLAAELPDSAKPYKSGGVMVIATDRVAEAIADRLLDANPNPSTGTDGDGEAGHGGVAG